MSIFDKTYNEAAKTEPSASSALEHMAKGAAWQHRDGRALTLDGTTARRLSASFLARLVRSGVIVEDGCPLERDVAIYVLPAVRSPGPGRAP